MEGEIPLQVVYNRRLIAHYWRSALIFGARISTRKADALLTICADRSRLEATPVHLFMDLLVV